MLALRPLISALIVVSRATPLIGAPEAAGNFPTRMVKILITRTKIPIEHCYLGSSLGFNVFKGFEFSWPYEVQRSQRL